MKRYLFFPFLLLFIIYYLLLAIRLPSALAQSYSTCDLSGFCPPNQPPSNWENCRACLYQSSSTDPNSLETLVIEPTTNLPPTPMPGRWYTFIGCVKTNLNSFESEGAAGSVVQILLDLLFSVAGGLSLIYFIYGSFLILTSQSEPERLNQGRGIIYGAIAGIVFSLSAVFLINLIASGILKIPGFSSPIP